MGLSLQRPPSMVWPQGTAWARAGLPDLGPTQLTALRQKANRGSQAEVAVLARSPVALSPRPEGRGLGTHPL